MVSVADNENESQQIKWHRDDKGRFTSGRPRDPWATEHCYTGVVIVAWNGVKVIAFPGRCRKRRTCPECREYEAGRQADWIAETTKNAEVEILWVGWLDETRLRSAHKRMRRLEHSGVAVERLRTTFTSPPAFVLSTHDLTPTTKAMKPLPIDEALSVADREMNRPDYWETLPSDGWKVPPHWRIIAKGSAEAVEQAARQVGLTFGGRGHKVTLGKVRAFQKVLTEIQGMSR